MFFNLNKKTLLNKIIKTIFSKSSLFFLIIFIFVSIFLITPDLIFAEEESRIGQFVPQVSIPGSDFGVGAKIDIDGLTLARYISALYQWALGAIGALSAVMIVIAGAQWMLAAGNASKIGDAKDRLTHALIGLLIALSSFLVLNFINPELVIFKELRVEKIERITLNDFHVEIPTNPKEWHLPGSHETNERKCGHYGEVNGKGYFGTECLERNKYCYLHFGVSEESWNKEVVDGGKDPGIFLKDRLYFSLSGCKTRAFDWEWSPGLTGGMHMAIDSVQIPTRDRLNMESAKAVVGMHSFGCGDRLQTGFGTGDLGSPFLDTACKEVGIGSIYGGGLDATRFSSKGCTYVLFSVTADSATNRQYYKDYGKCHFATNYLTCHMNDMRQFCSECKQDDKCQDNLSVPRGQGLKICCETPTGEYKLWDK